MDDDSVRALKHAMPPSGGLGIGIDRRRIILLNQPSMGDVILFPLLRPQTAAGTASSAGGDWRLADNPRKDSRKCINIYSAGDI